jgi:hypothetical protein
MPARTVLSIQSLKGGCDRFFTYEIGKKKKKKKKKKKNLKKKKNRGKKMRNAPFKSKKSA